MSGRFSQMKKSRRFCQMKKSCVSCKRYTDHLGGKMNCFLRRMTANFKDGMIMPNRFLNHFEGKISGTIKLESPNGNLYDVEVAERMNKTVLRCGWEAFVDAHHIEENDSVLFRHIENSRFEVLILDSDDCEKVIPCSGIKNTSCVQERRVGSVKISSNSSDDTTQSSRSKRFARCRRGSSSDRREIEKMAAKSCSSEESGEDSPSENESFEPDDLRSPPGPDYVLSRRSYLSDAEKDKVFALIQKIQPEVTVFVAIMRKCSVQPSAPFVVISKDYAAVHFPHGSATVTLQRPDKCKKWHPRFYKRKDGSAYMLRGNWLDFVRDNCVQEGDICLFVPTKGGGRFTFTVHLLHAEAAHSRAGTGVPRVGSCHGRTSTKMAAKSCSSEESGEDSPDENESFESDDLRSSPGPDYVLSRRSYLSDAEKDKVFALIQKIQPEVTVFVAIMRKCNVQPSAPFVVISKDYAAVHFPHGSATVTLQRPDKCKKWRPRLYKRKDGSAYMLRGNWLDFVRDNRVQEGDICLFVPTKGGRRFTFTVHLLHAAAAHSRAGTGVRRVGSCHGRTITKMASAVHIKEEPTDGENASSSESDKHGVSHESLESMDSDDPPEPSYILPLRNCLSQSQKKLVEEKVRAIRSKIPIYVAIMKNVPQHHTLEFASRYADLHLPGRKQTLVLQCMGKVWKTKMLVSNRNRWFLSGGWSKFTRDNRLRVGDICLFELKKNERKLAMTVHIIFSEQCSLFYKIL